MQPVALRELIAACDGTPIAIDNLDVRFERVEIDSRRVRAGDVFWAVVGQHNDGHNYVQQAIERGAVACVVEEKRAPEGVSKLILVEESILALWDFAEWYRTQFEALIIGVTGTVGKTTTRHMLQRVLNARYVGIESIGNFNNYLGVPLSLLQLNSQHEFAVIEIAASQVGEIEDLASIAQPEVGVITTISPVHLDEFKTLEAIIQAKGELLEALPESGFAVLNGDDHLVRQLAERASCPVIFVGEQTHNDLVAQWVRVENGWLRFNIESSEFDVPVVGRHHITSAIAAVAVGRQIDLSDDEIAAGLRMFEPVSGRSELLRIGPWIVINDTYNASPASMQAACHALRDWSTNNKRILIAGDMLELGPESVEYHRQIGQLVAQLGLHQMIAVGTQAASIAGTAKEHGMDAGCLGVCSDAETARLLIDCWLEPGDVVLVKGSRELQMEQFITYLEDLAKSRSATTATRKVA